MRSRVSGSCDRCGCLHCDVCTSSFGRRSWCLGGVFVAAEQLLELVTAVCPEFAEDVVEVGFGGADRDHQLLGDLLAGQARRGELGDLLLPGGERGRRRGVQQRRPGARACGGELPGAGSGVPGAVGVSFPA
jgi:hypothetical protein